MNPNDYSLKEDGTASDVANTDYDGNAMAQFPLCWVYRYEDANYYYEIVSNVQYDENYKAYAHTDANGNIKDYFYWSLFTASGDTSKFRSLSGKSSTCNITISAASSAISANGDNWYIASWSQYELIRTLLVLISKSCDSQAIFGYGNTLGTSPLDTAALIDKGQFFGFNSDFTHAVKVFHIENFWGNLMSFIVGFINSRYTAYVKLTPENGGYPVDSVTGYSNTGIVMPFTSRNFINAVNCSEFGCIPISGSGSSSTYFCDAMWSENVAIGVVIRCGYINAPNSNFAGIFMFNCSTLYSSSAASTFTAFLAYV